MSIKTLVLSGEGINCENETAAAFKLAGSEVEIIPFTDFIQLKSFDSFDILAFPGGFSYADEIQSGKIIAEKIRTSQLENINRFNVQKKPIIGICNGFQILTQLGLFGELPYRLVQNQQKTFINKWVSMKIQKNECLWLKDLGETIRMPIRHKEGKLYLPEEYQNKYSEMSTPLIYTEDVNGAFKQAAALTNKTGNILGLMPHPEAAIHEFLNPDVPENAKLNLKIFQNAIDYCQKLKKE